MSLNRQHPSHQTAPSHARSARGSAASPEARALENVLNVFRVRAGRDIDVRELETYETCLALFDEAAMSRR